MDIIQKIKKQAKGLRKKIIFPEATDERILKAVEQATRRKIIKAILVGNENEIKAKARSAGVNLKGIEIINPVKSRNLEKYASLYSKKTKTGKQTALLIAQKPLFFAALAVSAGHADGMVAGAVHTSGDVIAVSKNIIGLQKGISVPSSFFIMTIPNYQGGENGALLYADASVNPNPTAEELADIAVISGQTAKRLLKWKPRIAMLSFSTKGSAEHPDVCKVIKAAEIARKKSKGLAIEGELQADSALVLSTAKKKIKGKIGNVAGRANVLIFPDLDAGNITYKITQILAKANAYGPILQGFARPVSDLSRGATVEDINGVIAILAVWSKRWKS
jgi:phosphate acetyltransferase